ncbi:hypothetical protein BJ508DRAFT_337417 [Ascobolus immersus RN42]|uniref:Uncharacterized protein n=1 Tax=Ascobolus immersus RN42 TaxID=1160509 RepID=A0A3N4IQP3_ASCIM|nr:hypothetical protein BJ508DRAFT_337417 [Ascobolus immersus RN42]
MTRQGDNNATDELENGRSKPQNTSSTTKSMARSQTEFEEEQMIQRQKERLNKERTERRLLLAKQPFPLELAVGDFWDDRVLWNDAPNDVIVVICDWMANKPLVSPDALTRRVTNPIPTAMLEEWADWRVSCVEKESLEYWYSIHLNTELNDDPETAAKLLAWTMDGFALATVMAEWFRKEEIMYRELLEDQPLAVVYQTPAFVTPYPIVGDENVTSRTYFPATGPYFNSRYNVLALDDQEHFWHVVDALEEKLTQQKWAIMRAEERRTQAARQDAKALALGRRMLELERDAAILKPEDVEAANLHSVGDNPTFRWLLTMGEVLKTPNHTV